MTLAVFPSFSGADWGNIKHPDFKTDIFEATSGYESRAMLRQYPKYTFHYPLEHIIDSRDESDLRALLGFFLARHGAYEAFLFTDLSDCAVDGQMIGVGDGTRTVWQLVRSYGGFVEPVQNVNAVDSVPAIFLDDVLQVDVTDYGIADDGLVTFASAPADGAVITWTGNYYYRVRFVDDGYDFAQFSSDFWQCADIAFVGSVRNVV